MCRYQTHKFASHCPQCGATLQSKRWSRRFGKTLVVGGVIITALTSVVRCSTAPLLGRPGVNIGGMRFSGSPAQAVAAFAVMATLFVVGVTTMRYGVWQVRSGGRSLRIVAVLVGIAAALWLVAMLL